MRRSLERDLIGLENRRDPDVAKYKGGGEKFEIKKKLQLPKNKGHNTQIFESQRRRYVTNNKHSHLARDPASGFQGPSLPLS